ncbi:MAG: hypothetical protein Q8P11_03555 [bacterium]|nr:hypothetical protein [bacterium]
MEKGGGSFENTPEQPKTEFEKAKEEVSAVATDWEYISEIEKMSRQELSRGESPKKVADDIYRICRQESIEIEKEIHLLETKLEDKQFDGVREPLVEVLAKIQNEINKLERDERNGSNP